MRDLQRAARAARDGDRLVDRVEQAVVLVAHVGVVREAARGERAAKGDELLERREGAGGVLETARRTERAVPQRLLDESDHAREFAGRRRAVIVADDEAADAAEADHGADVGAGREGVDAVEELADRDVSRGPRALHRCARRAVSADHVGGDPLPHEALDHRIGEEGAVAMRVNVDEPGRDDQTATVDHAHGAHGDARGDGGDSVAGDREVGLEARPARSVDDRAAAEEQVGVAAAEADERWGAGQRGERGGGLRDEIAALHEGMKAEG